MHEAQRYPKVLVVEDDNAIRGLLVHALRLQSLGVDEAADAAEAARLARENEYSLMLVDFMLPDVNGVDFLRSFRDVRPAATTVIVLMTAGDEDIVRDAASDLAHGFIRKPFDILDLAQTITDIAVQAEDARLTIRCPKDKPWLAC